MTFVLCYPTHTDRESHIRTLQSDTVVPLCSQTSSFTAVTTVTHSSHTGRGNGSRSIDVYISTLLI